MQINVNLPEEDCQAIYVSGYGFGYQAIAPIHVDDLCDPDLYARDRDDKASSSWSRFQNLLSVVQQYYVRCFSGSILLPGGQTRRLTASPVTFPGQSRT